MIPWPFPPSSGGNGRGGNSREEASRASQYLHDLADHSGARLYRAETLGNVSNAFSLIAEELRSQYSLSYYPTNAARDGSYRRIRVTVDQSNVVVQAREGYRAASDAQAQVQSESAPATRPRR
jgi:VWFA-related protein